MENKTSKKDAIAAYSDRWGYRPLLGELPMELRADEEVVIASLKTYGTGAINLRGAAPALLKSKEFALKVAASMPNNQGLLGEFSDVLREDRDVVLAFCAQWPHGAQLEFAGPKARSDRDIVFAALKASGMALEFAGTEFRKDFEAIQCAVRRTPHAIQHMDAELLSNRAFMLELLSKTSVSQGVLQFLSDSMRDDKEIVMAILRTDWQSFEHASERLRGDRDVMWEALTRTNDWYKASAFEHAAEELKRDTEFAKKAVAMVRQTYGREKGEAVETIMKPHREAKLRGRAEKLAAKEQAIAEKAAAKVVRKKPL